jgi:hypothetical protein
MDDQSKNRVVGAFVVGFAIVAGAYTISSFTKPTISVPGEGVATVAAAPTRIAIPVQDSNKDGIEDWRETFIDPSLTLRFNASSTTYVPETRTEQLGISFFQDMVRMKGYEGIGRTQNQIIEATVDQITGYAQDRILDLRDIKIGTDKSPAAVRAYANQAAQIVILNNPGDTRQELIVLDEALKTQSQSAIDELGRIATAYRNTLAETAELVVPPQLAKQHLDLLNVYQALYLDINSMASALRDPIVAFARIKRYEDDATGLVLALENLYKAIAPYASEFKRDDPALLFVSFSPSFQ